MDLAKLLLEAGADPNDCQALYNRMFRPNNICLETLLGYGLNTSHTNNWCIGKHGGYGELIPHDQRTLEYQMQWAITNNFFDRVNLLVSHGTDVNFMMSKGERPLRHATLHGYQEIRDLLIEKGAKKERFKKVEHFIAAMC